jgi:hypothetical protein
MSKPQRFVESIVTNYQINGHPLTHLKMDNRSLSLSWNWHIKYQFNPPYEHEFIGSIERNNRTTQDKLSCILTFQLLNLI